MQTRGKITAITLASALVLGGGAAAAIGIGGLTPAEPVAASDPTPSASAAAVEAPLSAETPEPVESGEEDAYLVAVRESLYRWPGTQIPDATDEQLLTAAADACEQLAAGATTDDVRVIDGETANDGGYFQDSAIIGERAIKHFCPGPA